MMIDTALDIIFLYKFIRILVQKEVFFICYKLTCSLINVVKVEKKINLRKSEF